MGHDGANISQPQYTATHRQRWGCYFAGEVQIALSYNGTLVTFLVIGFVERIPCTFPVRCILAGSTW